MTHFPVLSPEGRLLLDKLDEYFSTAPLKDAEALWNVLTALRGPDAADDTDTIKMDSTVPIRCAAFPRQASLGPIRVPASFYRDDPDAPVLSHCTLLSAANAHFARHIKMAVAALGLQQIEDRTWSTRKRP